MYIFGHISVKQRQLPDQKLDSAPEQWKKIVAYIPLSVTPYPLLYKTQKCGYQ